jgi:periplasmic divalent cation tolerance protein
MPSSTTPLPPGWPEESELVLVLTTEATLQLAEQLAHALLERELVACVSFLPIVSLYRWEGQRMRSEEVQLLLKTQPACLKTLHATILSLHSYETPEWITIRGHTCGDYGLWCSAQITTPWALSPDDGPPVPPRNSGDEAPVG